MARQISDSGINAIKQFEGEKLKAYKDSVGVWTIGVGHTKGVKKGQVISRNQSTQFLLDDLKDAEKTVNSLVTAPVTQAQYDALVSLVFNIGTGNFRRSSVLRHLNNKRYGDAADAFLLFNKGRINGTLRVINGLTRRRKAERKMFIG